MGVTDFIVKLASPNKLTIGAILVFVIALVLNALTNGAVLAPVKDLFNAVTGGIDGIVAWFRAQNPFMLILGAAIIFYIWQSRRVQQPFGASANVTPEQAKEEIKEHGGHWDAQVLNDMERYYRRTAFTKVFAQTDAAVAFEVYKKVTPNLPAELYPDQVIIAFDIKLNPIPAGKSRLLLADSLKNAMDRHKAQNFFELTHSICGMSDKDMGNFMAKQIAQLIAEDPEAATALLPGMWAFQRQTTGGAVK